MNENPNTVQQPITSNGPEEMERPSSTESCPNFPTAANEASKTNSASIGVAITANGKSGTVENRSSAMATKNTFNFLNRLTKRVDACVAEVSRNGNSADIPLVPMHSLPAITKMVPYTTFENGVQVIKNPWILEKLTSKEGGGNGSDGMTNGEDETVTMVVPQDAANRLHSMSLRTRRHPDPSTSVKEIPKRDQELYERLAIKCAPFCDLASLQCSVCKKTFKVCGFSKRFGVPCLTWIGQC